MDTLHFVLVTVPTIGKARTAALAALKAFKHRLRIVDRRVPEGHRTAYAFGSAEFANCLHVATLMQGSSLMSVHTMLSNIFGDTPAEAFEKLYLHNPDEYKKVLANSFKFMGECAADSLLDRRVPRAVPGQDWERGDFDTDGFLYGLEEMCKLKKLLAGEYCIDSYFLNATDMSGRLPSETELNSLNQQAKEQGHVLAIVPVKVAEAE